MDRRTFLTRSGLALGTILVGDDLIEELVRLAHVRKSFPSAGLVILKDESLVLTEKVFATYNCHVEAWRDIEATLARLRVPPGEVYQL